VGLTSGGSRILKRGRKIFVRGGRHGGGFLLGRAGEGRILMGCILSLEQRLHTAEGRDGVGAGGGRPEYTW
jgi:hypothetical protein